MESIASENEHDQRARLIANNNEIARHASRKELQQALVVFDSMKAEDNLNSHSYAAALNAYVRCGDIVGARQLFDEIRDSKRFKLDVIMFTTMMKGYCAEGDIANATQLLMNMSSSKPPVQPNIRTINTYFRGCVITGAVYNAIAAFERLKIIYKLPPDVSTYESMIMVCCQALLLDIVLPMIGRIKSEETMKSGLSSMYCAVGRAAAILGDLKLMRKSLASALEHISYINDEDGGQEFMCDNSSSLTKKAVSGGKRSWHAHMAESRVDSLAMFRAHKQEELTREIDLITQFGNQLQQSTSGAGAGQLPVALAFVLRMLLFSTRTDQLHSELFPSEANDPEDSATTSISSQTKIDGIVHRLLTALIEKLGLCVLLGKSCGATAGEAKSKFVPLSEVTSYTPSTTPSVDPILKGNGSKKAPKKADVVPKHSFTLDAACDVRIPTEQIALLTQIKDHLKQYVSSDGRLVLSKVFSSFTVGGSPGSTIGELTQVPVHMEICSGAGEWVVAQAKANPTSHWIASELRHDRVYQTFSRAVCNGASNLAVLGGDIMNISRNRLASDSVRLICVNHPEPPQQHSEGLQSQAKHLLDESFFLEMGRVLELHGMLTIVTDNAWYSKFLAHNLAHSSLLTDHRTFRAKSGGVFCAVSQSIAGQCSLSGSESWEVSWDDGPVQVLAGNPGPSCGYFVEASSYFDRLWKRSQLSARYFIVLRKVRAHSDAQIHPSYLSKLASAPSFSERSSFGKARNERSGHGRQTPAAWMPPALSSSPLIQPPSANKKIKFDS